MLRALAAGRVSTRPIGGRQFNLWEWRSGVEKCFYNLIAGCFDRYLPCLLYLKIERAGRIEPVNRGVCFHVPASVSCYMVIQEPRDGPGKCDVAAAAHGLNIELVNYI